MKAAFPWRAILAAVRRESRGSRARLVFFTGCLSVGVAAVVGVGALVGAVEGGLQAETRELLAADLKVSARRPLPDDLDEFLGERPFRRSNVLELAAMALHAEAEASRLVELKVVDELYPFYGDLVLDPPERTTADLGDDAIFAAPELGLELGLELGDTVSIGGADFRVAGWVEDEPDRLDFAMTLGPRVFVGHGGLARTNLSKAQNRLRYRALYALDETTTDDELDALAEELDEKEGEYLSVDARSEAQPNVGRALRRVRDFLGLVALLSLLLGGIGVAQIVRAWMVGRTRDIAVMRSLGYRAIEVAAVYLGHVLLLAALGSLVGAVLGASVPWIVRIWAPELFRGGAANLWQPLAALRGIGLGVAVALFFSLSPLGSIWRVPPAAVLRAEAAPLRVPLLVRWGAPAALFVGVLLSAWSQAGDWSVAASFSGGLFVLTGLLWAGARGAAALCARVPRGRLGPYLEHGLAALARPGAGAVGAIVALGLGAMVLVSMFLVEDRLQETLRGALPEDAPTLFLVDIQPDQWAGVETLLDEGGARSVDSTPVVMARMREIDGEDVNELVERSDERRARWVFTREQRLTWMDELPEDNVIVAGELWSVPDVDEVSIEVDFAEDLGVGVGSTLTLDVQGIPVTLRVTSLREVDWQGFGINFFLVVEPGVLEEAPHFRIAAAGMDSVDGEYALQNAISAEHPNVTMLRIRPILEKIAAALERLAFGVRALAAFTIVTGLVILAGAVGSTALRRTREAALLKVLGVTRSGVVRLFAIEYALTGAVAGAIGALGALTLSWAFLEQVLELETELPWIAIPVTALAAAVLSIVSGLAASGRALRVQPVETLRG